MKVTIVLLLLALLACGGNAFQMRPVNNNNNIKMSDSPFNGSVSLGTLLPTKWYALI